MNKLRCNPLVLWFSSLLFWLIFASSTVGYGVVIWALIVLPPRIRFPLIMSWTRFNLWVLARLCGLDHRVEGLEDLPDAPMVVLAKHQSTWETLALSAMFPTVAWVLKKELLRIPFFGWGIRLLDQIAIDRSAGRNAVEQVVAQGAERLAAGRKVIVFPEGTRMPPGKRGRYKLGGAILATRSGYPVVPLAHNAGYFWPRHQFIKYPGVITLRFGPMIDTQGRDAAAVNRQVEDWIEGQMPELGRLAEQQLKACKTGFPNEPEGRSDRKSSSDL